MKKLKNAKSKIFASSLCMLAVLSLIQIPVYATTSHDISKGDITISDDGSCSGHTITGTSSAHQIKVTGGTHNITLNNVDIDLSGTGSTFVDGKSAFDIAAGAKVTITVSGTNSLRSGKAMGGINVPDTAEVILNGDDSSVLNTSSNDGTGIGSQKNVGCGTITINSGTINATATNGHASIGGSNKQSGGSITITGGTIKAYGTSAGPGIGSGDFYAGSSQVTITGGTIFAGAGNGTSGAISAGPTGTVTISDKASVIAYTRNGSAINTDTFSSPNTGTSANILMFTYNANTTKRTEIKDAHGIALSPELSHLPELSFYKSIAFTVPSVGTYTAYVDGVKQSGLSGGTTSTGFTVVSGLNSYTNVQDIPDYTGTQAQTPSNTPISKTDTSIILASVTVGNETIEYAKNTTNTAPTDNSDWQDSTTFNGLTSDTAYYFFARVKANDTHKAGVASSGTSIKTDKTDTQKIMYVKKTVEEALKRINVSNDTKDSDIMKVITNTISSTGYVEVSANWDKIYDFKLHKATNSQKGSITGIINLKCGTENDSITINISIEKLSISSNRNTNSPITGDTSNIVIYLTLIMMSSYAITFLIRKKQ